MNRLLLVVVLGCSAEPVVASVVDDPCAAPPQSAWPAERWCGDAAGEAPDFCFDEERRAPKMPDADEVYAKLRPRVLPLDDGLLICHVETYSRDHSVPIWYRYKLGDPPTTRTRCGLDWDPLGPPDTLLRFRLGSAPAVALFGPEDHWGFFVSIPRVSLAVGDTVAIEVWDRDTSVKWKPGVDDELMGSASVRFDGQWPLRLQGAYFALQCQALSREETQRAAASTLATLDRRLKEAAAWKPDINARDFGQPEADAASLSSPFGAGNFRYAAGFLGWSGVRDRLTRWQAIVQQQRQRRAEAVAAAIARAPRGLPEGVKALGCSADGCEFALNAREVSLAGLNEEGRWSEALPIPTGWRLPKTTKLLWLGGLGKKAQLARLD